MSKTKYDVIIIGGGGHGLATAFYLAKEFNIKNIHRTVGTRISHHLYKKYGNEKLENDTYSIFK